MKEEIPEKMAPDSGLQTQTNTLICRLCFMESDRSEKIFDEGKDYFSKWIEKLTSLKLVYIPNAPAYLCSDCKSTLETFDSFREMCFTNDLVFNETFCGNNVKAEKPPVVEVEGQCDEVQVNNTAFEENAINVGDYEISIQDADDNVVIENPPAAIELRNIFLNTENVSVVNVVNKDVQVPSSADVIPLERCKVCNENATKLHLLTHKNKHNFFCLWCSKKCKQFDHIIRHMAWHKTRKMHLKPKKQQIQLENKSLDPGDKLAKRKKREDESTSIKQTVNQTKRKHRKRKSKRKTLEESDRLADAELLNTKFLCETCEKFTSELHSLTHREDQHFHCNSCPSKFRFLSYLSEHIDECHRAGMGILKHGADPVNEPVDAHVVGDPVQSMADQLPVAMSVDYETVPPQRMIEIDSSVEDDESESEVEVKPVPIPSEKLFNDEQFRVIPSVAPTCKLVAEVKIEGTELQIDESEDSVLLFQNVNTGNEDPQPLVAPTCELVAGIKIEQTESKIDQSEDSVLSVQNVNRDNEYPKPLVAPACELVGEIKIEEPELQIDLCDQSDDSALLVKNATKNNEHSKKDNTTAKGQSVCKTCGKMVTKMHMITHKADGMFWCYYCPKTFAKYDYVRKHVKLHTEKQRARNEMAAQKYNKTVQPIACGNQQFVDANGCEVSSEGASNSATAELSNDTQAQQTEPSVDEDKFASIRKVAKDRYLAKSKKPSHDSEMLFCKICKIFASKLHIKTHKAKGLFRCHICGRIFDNFTYICKHISTHSKK
ncbi:uncharacterized protein LOC134214588 [Armigeres subalbatus]|uniref:uncharacterized protein LOC134214588 n=1 Tax=Armigeres subalbatus TaxID=124917 RepID=UPI002ED3A889